MTSLSDLTERDVLLAVHEEEQKIRRLLYALAVLGIVLPTLWAIAFVVTARPV